MLVEDYRMHLNCIPSESVTIYTGGVLCDKPTNPTISLGISYTRLEIIGESVGNKYKDIMFQHPPPPAVEASASAMQRLERNSWNAAVGNPLVMMSANCWVVVT